MTLKIFSSHDFKEADGLEKAVNDYIKKYPHADLRIVPRDMVEQGIALRGYDVLVTDDDPAEGLDFDTLPGKEELKFKYGLKLTDHENTIYETLRDARGGVVSVEMLTNIYAQARGLKYPEQTTRSTLRSLQKKMDQSPIKIENVKGKGYYLFIEPRAKEERPFSDGVPEREELSELLGVRITKNDHEIFSYIALSDDTAIPVEKVSEDLGIASTTAISRISALRSKLIGSPYQIRNYHGVGYGIVRT